MNLKPMPTADDPALNETLNRAGADLAEIERGFLVLRWWMQQQPPRLEPITASKRKRHRPDTARCVGVGVKACDRPAGEGYPLGLCSLHFRRFGHAIYYESGAARCSRCGREWKDPMTTGGITTAEYLDAHKAIREFCPGKPAAKGRTGEKRPKREEHNA